MRRLGAIVWSGVVAACADGTGEADLAREWRSLKAEIRARYPEVAQLEVAEFARARPAEVYLVDVREAEEFEVSRIPGAVNIPIGDGLVDAFSAIPRDRPIVVYCSVGYRSSRAARELTRAGYRSVRNLEGSIFEWANEGHPLEGGPGVHPYDQDWGRLLRR